MSTIILEKKRKRRMAAEKEGETEKIGFPRQKSLSQFKHIIIFEADEARHCGWNSLSSIVHLSNKQNRRIICNDKSDYLFGQLQE